MFETFRLTDEEKFRHSEGMRTKIAVNRVLNREINERNERLRATALYAEVIMELNRKFHLPNLKKTAEDEAAADRSKLDSEWKSRIEGLDARREYVKNLKKSNAGIRKERKHQRKNKSVVDADQGPHTSSEKKYYKRKTKVVLQCLFLSTIFYV